MPSYDAASNIPQALLQNQPAEAVVRRDVLGKRFVATEPTEL
jgi:hypothetical protein